VEQIGALPPGFSELLQSIPDGVLVATTAGRIIAVNAQLCALAGYDEAELREQPIESLVPIRSRAEHVALRTAYADTDGGVRAMSDRPDIALRRADGTEQPVDIALCTIPYADDHVVIATVRDASARRRSELVAERERAFLTAMNDVTGALLGGGAVDETLRAVTGHARALLDADLALLVLPERDRESLVIRVADGYAAHDLEFAVLPVERSLSGMVMREGEPILVAHASKDDRVFMPPSWPDDLGPALFVPLQARGETIGSLIVASRRAKPMFAASDVTLMKAFAAHAAIAVTDGRAQVERQRTRVYEDRDRVAASLHDDAINRISGAALTLHGLLQSDLAPDLAGRLWSVIDELDAAIAAIRTAVFPTT